MSAQYDLYLQQHKENVRKGCEWIWQNLPELLENAADIDWYTDFAHDASKSEPDEYDAYDAYFYGGNRSYKVVQEFNKAWLLHIHRNPHHWQHWVLINDDPEEGEICIDIPYQYIIEMICDWWSFSWQQGNLLEIFNWYGEHEDHIKLSDTTRKTVESILDKIRNKISEDLTHHGIKGQKWGVKNGPPYPLKSSSGKTKSIIPVEKLLNYALDYEKAPDKAKAFEDALGYTKDNHKDLMDNINRNVNLDHLVEKGNDGYGMRYEYIAKLHGPNGKNANVLTAWIDDGDDSVRMTSVYVTKKKETEP